MSLKRNPKFKIALFLLIPSAPSSSVEGRDTCMGLENFYVTPCFSHDYHLTVVEYIKPQNTESECTTREKETDRDTFFLKKKLNCQKIKIKNKKNALSTGHRAEVTCCPVNRVPI
jgi:hypothetical protein